MKNIISIRERIEIKKQKEQIEHHRRKATAIQKVVQCPSCQLSCAMCGHHLSVAEASSDSSITSKHTLCESCRDEFKDYLAISIGNNLPKVFWHNKEWKNMWSAWLNYRQAIAGFMNSDEYKLLVEELEEGPEKRR